MRDPVIANQVCRIRGCGRLGNEISLNNENIDYIFVIYHSITTHPYWIIIVIVS